MNPLGNSGLIEISHNLTAILWTGHRVRCLGWHYSLNWTIWRTKATSSLRLKPVPWSLGGVFLGLLSGGSRFATLCALIMGKLASRNNVMVTRVTHNGHQASLQAPVTARWKECVTSVETEWSIAAMTMYLWMDVYKDAPKRTGRRENKQKYDYHRIIAETYKALSNIRRSLILFSWTFSSICAQHMLGKLLCFKIARLPGLNVLCDGMFLHEINSCLRQVRCRFFWQENTTSDFHRDGFNYQKTIKDNALRWLMPTFMNKNPLLFIFFIKKIIKKRGSAL